MTILVVDCDITRLGTTSEMPTSKERFIKFSRKCSITQKRWKEAIPCFERNSIRKRNYANKSKTQLENTKYKCELYDNINGYTSWKNSATYIFSGLIQTKSRTF